MAHKLSPLALSEIDDLIRVQFSAFGFPDMILPAVYPLGLQPDTLARNRSRHLASMQSETSTDRYWCIRDPQQTSQIISIAVWDIQTATKTPEELEDDYGLRSSSEAAPSNGTEGDAGVVPVDEIEVKGMNKALGRAFRQAAFATHHGIMQGAPHVHLSILATLPEYGRRGLASLHMAWGLAEAERLRLPVFLIASEQGRGLYERFGFETVKELPFDGMDFGGPRAPHWCMLRKAAVR